MKTKQEYIKFTKSILEFLDSIPDDVDLSIIEFIDVYKCDRNIEDFVILKGYVDTDQKRYQDVYSKKELKKKYSKTVASLDSLIETSYRHIKKEEKDCIFRTDEKTTKIERHKESIANDKKLRVEMKATLRNILAEGPKRYLNVKDPTKSNPTKSSSSIPYFIYG